MRQANLKLTYDGKDISRNIAPFVTAFSYTDHASGKADDLQITLEDRAQLWKNGWFPTKGATLDAEIICESWEKAGETLSLRAGIFEVDDLSASGSPDIFTIKAVSSAISSSLRREKKNKAWESTNLQAIAREMAGTHGLSMFYEADDVSFQRVDQKEESDLRFLQRLCKDNDLNLKVSEEKLIIFAGKKFEEKPASFTIVKGDGSITGYNLKSMAHDIYRSCVVNYYVPPEKTPRTYTYIPVNAPKVGSILKVNQRVESLAGAIKLAQHKLRDKNKHEVTGTLNIPGHPGMLAGLNIKLDGYGVFSGKYFIEKAVHRQAIGSGYTASVNIRKVLGY